MKESDQNEIFKVMEVARYLKVGKNTIYKLINTGELACVKIGRTIRIPKWCVLEYLQRQQELCYNTSEDRLPDGRRSCA